MVNDNKVKVLYVLDKSGFGGLQTIVNSLMDYNFGGAEVTYFYLRNINRAFGIENLSRDDVVYSQSTGKYNLICLWELYRLIKSGGFEVIHLNGTKSTILGYLIKRLLPRLKIISHDHNGEFDYRSGFVRFLKFISPHVDKFLCVSQRRKTFLSDICRIDTRKIIVLNNFVDEKRFAHGASEQKNTAEDHTCPDNTFVLGFVGRLSHVKGCDVLLRALPVIHQRIPSIKVLIAGDGPDRDTLGDLAESLGVAEFINFLGYVEEPRAVYSSADIIVIPSRAEEGPLTLFESWRMGVPVVASDAPVIDERIEDYKTGLFFPSEDTQVLAEKVAELFFDKDLQERLVINGQDAVKELTAENYVARLRDIYVAL